MTTKSVSDKILQVCSERKVTSVEELSNRLGHIAYDVINQTVIQLGDRGFLRVRIDRLELMDGIIETPDYIHGVTHAGYRHLRRHRQDPPPRPDRRQMAYLA